MLTPITAFYGGLLAIVFLYLSILVIKNRRAKKVSLGDGNDPHFSAYIRAQANFNEYVPLCLILLLNAELNHANAWILHSMGIGLLIGRLLHAYGLTNHPGASWQRIWGVLLTFATLLSGAVINLLFLY